MTFQETDGGVIFDHPPTAEELKGLCGACWESDDPASPYYKRVLVRPRLHLWRVLGYVALALCLASSVGVGVHLWLHAVFWTVVAGVGCLGILVICFAKRIAIWLVKVYQRFAPDKVRNRCRFEPSCSQYMILALEKYGFWRGLKKGITRFFRCKPPNGGFDEP